MTVNQVAYLNYKENARKNLAEEAEVQRHNLAMEQVQREQLLETQRRNVNDFLLGLTNTAVSSYHQTVQEKEANRKNTLGALTSLVGTWETQRHNRAQEAVSASDLSERVRHNTSTEWISAFELGESKRSNLARELETHRSNREQERRQAAALNEQIRTNYNRENLDAVVAYEKHEDDLTRLAQNQQQIDNNYRLGQQRLDYDYLKLSVDASSSVLGSLARLLTGAKVVGSFGGSAGGEFAPTVLQPLKLTASAGNG